MSDQQLSLVETANGLAPVVVLERATAIANAIGPMLVKQGLVENIQGNKFVKFEGWSCAMFMLGLYPYEEGVVEIADGVFEATISYRLRDGTVVSRASATCGDRTDMQSRTRSWRESPAQARRSMAITRAAGKASRMVASWIMSLAGFEPMSAEEAREVMGDVGEFNAKGQTNGPSPEADALIARINAATTVEELTDLSDEVNRLPNADRAKVGRHLGPAHRRISEGGEGGKP